MILKKVFSDSLSGERYFSVIMSEQEVQEFQKEFGILDKVKDFFGGNSETVNKLKGEVARYKDAASKASIARHETIANNLRMKKYLKRGGLAALGVAAAGGIGYGLSRRSKSRPGSESSN